MQFSQLKYFVKVVDCGSITKAAQELYISQPSLTKSIANLEAEFDLQLLERSAKGIFVTPKGREFLVYAKNVLDATASLEQNFIPREGDAVQHICIASQQFDFTYDLLEQVCRSHNMKNICLDLIECNRGQVIKQLENRTADLGIIVLTEIESKSFKAELRDRALEYHTLEASKPYIGMFPSSPLYHRDTVTETEAAAQMHVALDMDQGARREIYLRNKDYKVDSSQLIFCNTVSACEHFMKHCGAMLFAPKWLWGMFHDPQIKWAEIVRDDGSPYPEVNRLVWIKRKEEVLSRIETQFLELLQKRFGM